MAAAADIQKHPAILELQAQGRRHESQLSDHGGRLHVVEKSVLHIEEMLSTHLPRMDRAFNKLFMHDDAENPPIIHQIAVMSQGMESISKWIEAQSSQQIPKETPSQQMRSAMTSPWSGFMAEAVRAIIYLATGIGVALAAMFGTGAP